jgi:hypothetical protein
MLKEAALRTGALRALTGVGTRGSLPEDVLIERLLLIAYGYGTNSGLRTVAGRRSRPQRRRAALHRPAVLHPGRPESRRRRDRERDIRRATSVDLG